MESRSHCSSKFSFFAIFQIFTAISTCADGNSVSHPTLSKFQNFFCINKVGTSFGAINYIGYVHGFFFKMIDVYFRYGYNATSPFHWSQKVNTWYWSCLVASCCGKQIDLINNAQLEKIFYKRDIILTVIYELLEVMPLYPMVCYLPIKSHGTPIRSNLSK